VTEEETQNFFDKVKEKKIRLITKSQEYWSWGPNNYFIPKILYKTTKLMQGIVLSQNNMEMSWSFGTHEGFNYNSEDVPIKWAFFGNQDNQIDPTTCSCDMASIILVTGCVCGGK